MTKRSRLPRSEADLEALAQYYSENDTTAEMEDGDWVHPEPMKTTSLRLPADLVESLKNLARSRGVRYTALVREFIEQAVDGEERDERTELRRLDRRVDRIEKAVGIRSSRSTAAATGRQQAIVRRSAQRISARAHRDDRTGGRAHRAEGA